MKKVIESNGQFFVKEYTEKGSVRSMSEPFATEIEALASINDEKVEVKEPKTRKPRAKKTK